MANMFHVYLCWDLFLSAFSRGGGGCWSILPGALLEKYFVQHLIGNDFKSRLLGLRVFQQPRTHREVGNNCIIALSGVCRVNDFH